MTGEQGPLCSSMLMLLDARCTPGLLRDTRSPRPYYMRTTSAHFTYPSEAMIRVVPHPEPLSREKVMLVRLSPELLRIVESKRTGDVVGSLQFREGERLESLHGLPGAAELRLNGQSNWMANLVTPKGQERIECYRMLEPSSESMVEVGDVVGRLLLRPRELDESARAEVRERSDRARELAKERKTVLVSALDQPAPKPAGVSRLRVVPASQPLAQQGASSADIETLVLLRGLSQDASLSEVKVLFEGMEPGRIGCFRMPAESRMEAAWQRRRIGFEIPFDTVYVSFRSQLIAKMALSRAIERAYDKYELNQVSFDLCQSDIAAYAYALGIHWDTGTLRHLQASFTSKIEPLVDIPQLLADLRLPTDVTYRPASLDVDASAKLLANWQRADLLAERAQLALEIITDHNPRRQKPAILLFLVNLRAALAAELDLLCNVLLHAVPQKDRSARLPGLRLVRNSGPEPSEGDVADLLPPYSAADPSDPFNVL